MVGDQQVPLAEQFAQQPPHGEMFIRLMPARL